MFTGRLTVPIALTKSMMLSTSYMPLILPLSFR